MSMSIHASYWQHYQAYQTTAGKSNPLSAQRSLTALVEISEAEEAPTQTLEEFKKEFHTFVDSVPIHPSQARASRSVSIHDTVFEKMMNDPEYKAEIESMVRKDFSANFSPSDPAFCTMRLDANGEYSGSAGGSFHMGEFDAQSADAFWKKESTVQRDSIDDSFWDRKATNKAAKRKADEQKLLEQLADNRQQQRDYLRELFAGKPTVYGTYQTAAAASSGGASAAPIFDGLV